jgi:hypothetical protein
LAASLMSSSATTRRTWTADSLDLFWSHIDRCRALADAALDPISDRLTVASVIANFERSGLFTLAIHDWTKRPAARSCTSPKRTPSVIASSPCVLPDSRVMPTLQLVCLLRLPLLPLRWPPRRPLLPAVPSCTVGAMASAATPATPVAPATLATTWLQPSTTCLGAATSSSAPVVKPRFGLPCPVRLATRPLLPLLPLQHRRLRRPPDGAGSLTY